MSQKRTLELTQEEINLILRALRIAEKTFDNLRIEYITKTNDDNSNNFATTETLLIAANVNQCFDLHFAIKQGQKDV